MSGSVAGKRVAFVTTIDSPWGGSEELWCRAADRLLDRGVSVAANARRTGELAAPLARLVSRGATVALRRGGVRLPGAARRIHADWTLRWLDRVRPHLVVISLGVHTQGAEWMEACRRRGLPYVLIVQCAGDLFWPDDIGIERLAEGYAGARACFFVSEANRELVQRQLSVALPLSAVARNPFTVAYDAAPAWPTGEALRLACVARLDPFAKGQDLLLRLMGLEKWRGRPVELTFCGNGANERALRRLAQHLGSAKVRFAGHVSGVESVWESHHALILASRFEGLPLAMVEAMLCGRPVIATDVGGNAELIDEGRTGYLAAAPTLAALDEALSRAWEGRAGLRAMGESARERVRSLVPPDPTGDFCERLLALL